MKGFVFGALTVAYVVIAYFVSIFIALSCGLGPDSPVACNAQADQNLIIFLIAAIVTYFILTVLFWRIKPSGNR